MRLALRGIVITAALTSALSLQAQRATLLHDATLIDGTGGAVRSHVDILVRDGLIVSVTSASAGRP